VFSFDRDLKIPPYPERSATFKKTAKQLAVFLCLKSRVQIRNTLEALRHIREPRLGVPEEMLGFRRLGCLVLI